jgi:hypothetical protein
MRSFIIDTLYQLIIIRVIKLRRMRWEGHIRRIREMRNAYKILIAKPTEKRSLGTCRRT